MLGKRDPQRDLFGAASRLGPELDQLGFYGRVAVEGSAIFRDEDFARCYSVIGRPSAPPSLVALACLLQHHDGVSDDEVIERLVAYSNAGADVLYAPGVKELGDIKAIVDSVAPKPVNVLLLGSDMNVADLAVAGVRLKAARELDLAQGAPVPPERLLPYDAQVTLRLAR